MSSRSVYCVVPGAWLRLELAAELSSVVSFVYLVLVLKTKMQEQLMPGTLWQGCSPCEQAVVWNSEGETPVSVETLGYRSCQEHRTSASESHGCQMEPAWALERSWKCCSWQNSGGQGYPSLLEPDVYALSSRCWTGRCRVWYFTWRILVLFWCECFIPWFFPLRIKHIYSC